MRIVVDMTGHLPHYCPMIVVQLFFKDAKIHLHTTLTRSGVELNKKEY